MLSARAKEVLYDSEVVLRLVDSELEELRESAGSATAAGEGPGQDTSVQMHPLRNPIQDSLQTSLHPAAGRSARHRHTH